MSIRHTAEDAGWSVRETAWSEPLQRVVQTKLAWPVADAVRDSGTTVKAGLATAADGALSG
ncbi:hypothetical protein BH20ACT15_BH20ACT15_05270 [soil metagenome]